VLNRQELCAGRGEGGCSQKFAFLRRRKLYLNSLVKNGCLRLLFDEYRQSLYEKVEGIVRANVFATLRSRYRGCGALNSISEVRDIEIPVHQATENQHVSCWIRRCAVSIRISSTHNPGCRRQLNSRIDFRMQGNASGLAGFFRGTEAESGISVTNVA
jgi:hypothetical protein